VTLFHEDTPYNLIRELKPNILVKGADWAKKDIVGSDIVNDVRSIPFIEGISTSKIIEKIKKL
jgi:D-beta-D-heptose 7-phosphate kinase/D-beta-D-heptose 1-phosphate adenosyltransferase